MKFASTELTSTKEHVAFCYDVLAGHFSGEAVASPGFDEAYWWVFEHIVKLYRSLSPLDPALTELHRPSIRRSSKFLTGEVGSPLFVTWNKASARGQVRLRGCIGTLEPRQLRKALKDYALTSALHDRRFPPIALDELASLHCTVSLLHSFQTASDWTDWTMGVHGLIINFKDPSCRAHRSATFLPEVAAHEGWTQLQTFESLVRKAGFHGSARLVLNSLEVTRYQSSACSMTYAEYFSVRARRSEGSSLPDPSIAITVPA